MAKDRAARRRHLGEHGFRGLGRNPDRMMNRISNGGAIEMAHVAAMPSERKMAASGHLWTIACALRDTVLPIAKRSAERLTFTVGDPRLGTVRLDGLYRENAAAGTLAVIIHGLGGSAASSYCANAAAAAARVGHSSLCLSMRGADMSGEDIYHAGLSADVRTVLAEPRFARYQRILLLGYSFGGYLAIRSAIDRIDSRLSAIAAVCPPLDLAGVMNAGEAPCRSLYRRAILVRLIRCYAEAAARKRVPTPIDVVRQARRCSEWNELTIVPRFGFRSVGDYYRSVDVIPGLHTLDVPCLIVASENDPIVPAHLLQAALAEANGPVTVRWTSQGGHIAFPARVSLGMNGPLGLENQLFNWFANC